MSDCKRTSTCPDFTADEVEVAEILLNLHKAFESSHQFPKKRFCIDGQGSDLPTSGSPMAFPSSIESDLKPLRRKNKAELLKESERLTNLQEQLQRELKKVEAYREQLMVENTMLQQRRQQMKKASLALPFTQSQPLIALAPQHQQPPPLILVPYQQMAHLSNSSVPLEEKNSSRLEYLQPSDLQYHYRIQMAAMAKNKATAALARRNRSLLLKAKNSNRVKSMK